MPSNNNCSQCESIFRNMVKVADGIMGAVPIVPADSTRKVTKFSFKLILHGPVT